jgi:transcriptional regulator with XRE-family HTH domain
MGMSICDSGAVFHVGDVIRKLRRERKWKVETLAKEAGVAKMTVSSIERGASNYRRDTLDRIAKALGTTADDMALSASRHAANVERASQLLVGSAGPALPDTEAEQTLQALRASVFDIVAGDWEPADTVALVEMLTLWGDLKDRDDRQLVLRTARRLAKSKGGETSEQVS